MGGHFPPVIKSIRLGPLRIVETLGSEQFVIRDYKPDAPMPFDGRSIGVVFRVPKTPATPERLAQFFDSTLDRFVTRFDQVCKDAEALVAAEIELRFDDDVPLPSAAEMLTRDKLRTIRLNADQNEPHELVFDAEEFTGHDLRLFLGSDLRPKEVDLYD
jgi:hypothetical protein